MYPGFEIKDRIVGKAISFDTVRLETNKQFLNPLDLESGSHITLTNESTSAIKLFVKEYYNKNPEIEEYIVSSESFDIIIKERDIDVAIRFLSYCLELSVETFAIRPADRDKSKINYIDGITNSAEYSINQPSWSELSDDTVDTNKIIEKQIPLGPESTSITSNRYREFIENTVLSPLKRSDWPEGAAWSINLAIHELREGRYDEAAYAFDAVRNSITKNPAPVKELEFNDVLNDFLVSLRDLSLRQSDTEYQITEQELALPIEDRPFIFIPIFISEPKFGDPYFRMSSPVWMANALVFVSAVASALGSPTISRAEVDPFGSDITYRNASFVLRSAKNLLELNGDTNQPTNIEKIDLIDIEQFAPTTILKRNFESLGYETIESAEQKIEFQGEDYSIGPDLTLKKDEEWFAVYYRHNQPTEIARKVDMLDNDISLILVSDNKFSDTVFDLASENSFIELFYLDVTDEVLRTADSGLPNRGSQPLTKNDVRDRLSELHTAAGECDDPQKKGDILEEFCEMLFDRLIDDTEVLRMNSDTGIEEIDLVLRNYQESEPWNDLSSIIMVECKNWTKSASSSVVRDFFAKADSLGDACHSGILISWSGITGRHDRDGAWGYIRDKKQDGFHILCFDGEEVKKPIKQNNPSKAFDKKYVEWITEY